MRTATTVATLFLAGIAGCAAPERPELDYLPPSGHPAAHRSAFVRQQPWLVWGNILDHLQQRGARVVDLDEAAGELVVIYSGDPEPYVDCGWIVSRDEDELERVPAARSEASFLRRREGEVVPVERDLRLDARMDVHVEPSGEDAIVRTDSTYVLLKTIRSTDAEQPLHAETISFATGQSDAFSSGTTCQPTGELERLVFEALPTVSLAARGEPARLQARPIPRSGRLEAEPLRLSCRQPWAANVAACSRPGRRCCRALALDQDQPVGIVAGIGIGGEACGPGPGDRDVDLALRHACPPVLTSRCPAMPTGASSAS